MRANLAAVVGVCVLSTAGQAAAQSPSNADLVSARQARFREIGAAFKAINDELKKDAPVKYVLSSSAARIASALAEVRPMFPAGTGQGSGLKTKAKGDIWNNRAEFDRLNAATASEALKLATLVRTADPGALRAQVKVVGSNCQSCHQKFRAGE